MKKQPTQKRTPGRPLLGKSPRAIRIVAYLTEAEYVEFAGKAAEKGISSSQLARSLILPATKPKRVSRKK